MTSKIFRSTLLVAILVLLCSLSIVMGMLYPYFGDITADQLSDELHLAVIGTEQNGLAYLESVEPERFRITWISPEGAVLFDSQVDAQDMDSHANREEFQEALLSGIGSSQRYSATLTEKTFYQAQQLSDGSVLRISTSQASSGALVIGMFHPIVFILVVAITLSAILARRMAKRIVQPLNELDLDHPLENDAYEELSPLLGRINQQHQQITAQIRSLTRKTNEFQQITAQMQEGLVLLDSQNTILSINPTAKALFDAQSSCVGKDFLTLDRSREMGNALQAALKKGHSSLRLERRGREYQFDVSRIESEGTIAGAVILAFDVTEQLYAERNRREFSANVSHELKTPLQSIIGSAELLENGLIQEEDIPRFVGHIRKEAARLVDLIEDIIRLSSLDEGTDLPKEPVELLPLAREVAQQLQPAAEKRQISITVTGEERSFTGVRRLLYEILYNLCDNAIKYNREGGSVRLHIAGTPEHPCFSVKDTGIGIPQEHQSRVFERFYRVDKSHSKQSGGTGLGLSIVKHAVAYHGGEISLTSIPGEGTTVTITF